jgi:hypothetical protein
MSAATNFDADGNRDTVLNRARRFFGENPDEMLTRADIQVKFDCGPDMANLVARALIQEGAGTREQLPRPPRVTRVARGKEFPNCLTTAERTALEAYMLHGNIAKAARATGRNYNTLSDYLKDARLKADVHTTEELAIRFLRAAQAAEARDDADHIAPATA